MHKQLVHMGLKLDQIAYNNLITILCRLGMTRKAISVLNEMMGNGISADTITYNALIHGYCKSSHLKMAFATV